MKYNTRKKRHVPSIPRRRSIRRRRKTIRKIKGGGFFDKLQVSRSLFSTDRISFYPTKFENNEFTFQLIPEKEIILDNPLQILCLSPAIDGYEETTTGVPKLKKYSKSTFDGTVEDTNNITLIIYKKTNENTAPDIIDTLYEATSRARFPIEQYSQFNEQYETIRIPINTRFIPYNEMKKNNAKTKNGFFVNEKPNAYIINTQQIPKNVDDFLKDKQILAPFSIELPVKNISYFMKLLKQKVTITI